MSLLGCSNQSSNGTTSSEEATVLRFSHFYPATSDINKEIFEPWAKKIEADSGGRLKVEVYPSATISKADTAYESAVKGTIDIGSQVQGYTSVDSHYLRLQSFQDYLTHQHKQAVCCKPYMTMVRLLTSMKIHTCSLCLPQDLEPYTVLTN